jgi:hypothetical protein
MSNLLKFEDWVNESIDPAIPEWREGGIVLIRGMVLNDGWPRLYAARISNLWRNQSGAIMVKLYPQIYIILKKGWTYTSNMIMTNPEVLKRALGMTSYTLALNAKTGKTPLWEKSINRVDFDKFLADWTSVLDTYTEFKF